MRFRILGPLEVQDGSRTVSLPQGRQRVLLAVLLLHANETLTSDRLIDGLWGEAPPSSAGSSLHNLVSGLRKALGDGRLVTRDGGYALQVADGELDAERFDALVREGRAALAGGEPERAAGRLREALELWHGPALGDLAYHQALAGEAEQLEEARLAALEERIDADLARRAACRRRRRARGPRRPPPAAGAACAGSRWSPSTAPAARPTRSRLIATRASA